MTSQATPEPEQPLWQWALGAALVLVGGTAWWWWSHRVVFAYVEWCHAQDIAYSFAYSILFLPLSGLLALVIVALVQAAVVRAHRAGRGRALAVAAAGVVLMVLLTWGHWLFAIPQLADHGASVLFCSDAHPPWWPDWLPPPTLGG